MIRTTYANRITFSLPHLLQSICPELEACNHPHPPGAKKKMRRDVGRCYLPVFRECGGTAAQPRKAICPLSIGTGSELTPWHAGGVGGAAPRKPPRVQVC